MRGWVTTALFALLVVIGGGGCVAITVFLLIACFGVSTMCGAFFSWFLLVVLLGALWVNVTDG